VSVGDLETEYVQMETEDVDTEDGVKMVTLGSVDAFFYSHCTMKRLAATPLPKLHAWNNESSFRGGELKLLSTLEWECGWWAR
jgi:hypothetical protein